MPRHARSCHSIPWPQNLFDSLDKEDDGIVYTKHMIVQLRALNEDMDKNLRVRQLDRDRIEVEQVIDEGELEIKIVI